MNEELEKFYKDHNIEYSADGIGNEIWSYKGITIASYCDMPNEVTHIYCHWSITKRDLYPRITAVYKVNKWYYHPDNEMSNIPWRDFKDPYKNIESFKEGLLESIKLLEPRIQILKGRITMLTKHRASKYSNEECFCDFSNNWDKVFGSGRVDAHVKFHNGNVLKCHKLENKIYAVDNENIYFCYNDGMWTRYFTLKKSEFLKIADKEFYQE